MVDLPEPDLPTSPSVSPRASVNEMSAAAVTVRVGCSSDVFAIGLAEAFHDQHRRFCRLDGPLRRPQRRHGIDQATRIGVLRPGQHVVGAALLDGDAVLQHDDAVGDIGDHAEIVGDEQHARCHACGATRAISLRICACVVTSSAVVGSSAISRRGSRASAMAIIDALALTAGKLVRVGCAMLRGVGQADLGQKLQHAGAPLRAVERAMRLKGLRDLVGRSA